MTTQPLVSLIVPTKNSAATLRDCLQSILDQSYPHCEIIVVDNYSTDDTELTCKELGIKYIKQGPERCTQRNVGANKAAGEYVAFIDSDMVLSTDVVSQSVAAMAKAGTVGVTIPEESFGIGFWAQCKKLERSFYNDVPWMQAARLFRKANFVALGGYDEAMVSGEDWDFSQRIGATGTIAVITALIYHNEGHVRLGRLLQKKYYYAAKFAAYTAKAEHGSSQKNQMSIISRYGLFLKKPAKLFKNPILGIGMLWMKTAEFTWGGFGYLLHRKNAQ
jgi:glycosyltransferase involved in cell wall biosynthesis